MASSILSSGLLGLGGMAIGKAIAPSAPAASPVAPVMPVADDAAVQAARRRSIAAQQMRSGRASTILTNNSDTLGG